MNKYIESLMAASGASLFIYLCGSFGLMTFDIMEWNTVARTFLPIWGLVAIPWYWGIKVRSKSISDFDKNNEKSKFK